MAKNKINDNLQTIAKWELQGLNQKEIAEKLGVTPRTLRNFKAKNPHLFSPQEKHDCGTSTEIELSLIKCALGYEYQEEVAVKIKEEVVDPKTNTILVKERVVVKKVTKWTKPDLNAQKYWLNNREAFGWMDNPHKVRTDIEMLELRKKELEGKEW